MTAFFRLINADDKETVLKENVRMMYKGRFVKNNFIVNPEDFFDVPGAPFAYWTSSAIRKSYTSLMKLEGNGRTAKQGLATADDARFIRLYWEVDGNNKWLPFSKGGEYSPYYYDVHLAVNWADDGREIKSLLTADGKQASRPQSTGFYKRPGLTWPLRTTSGLSVRSLPRGCAFGHKGPSVFIDGDCAIDLQALQAVLSSAAFSYILGVQVAAADAAARSYEVGLMQKMPIPKLTEKDVCELSRMVGTAWSLKRTLDITVETSHAYILPTALINRVCEFDYANVSRKFDEARRDINEYCYDLYQFSIEDRLVANSEYGVVVSNKSTANKIATEHLNELFSWACGVAFGRFDICLATGERVNPNVPEPFDPLPNKCPGMLFDGSTPFHKYSGIMVDEEGHVDDLAAVSTLVLETIDISVDAEIRQWLRKNFFHEHLKMYSKSRRKAPVYWPLQTISGSYTLWIYYDCLNEQTLFSCINNFVDVKLKSIADDLIALRSKASGSSIDERVVTGLADLESELKGLRDELLRIAQFWKPNLDDGVQITAAPLFKLFQDVSWKNKLKKTWEELEQGKYDWSHMAYNIWPERVLKKCHQDRSLAISHEIETALWEEVEVPAARGKGTKLVWQPKDMTKEELDVYIQQKIAEG